MIQMLTRPVECQYSKYAKTFILTVNLIVTYNDIQSIKHLKYKITPSYYQTPQTPLLFETFTNLTHFSHILTHTFSVTLPTALRSSAVPHNMD